MRYRNCKKKVSTLPTTSKANNDVWRLTAIRVEISFPFHHSLHPNATLVRCICTNDRRFTLCKTRGAVNYSRKKARRAFTVHYTTTFTVSLFQHATVNCPALLHPLHTYTHTPYNTSHQPAIAIPLLSFHITMPFKIHIRTVHTTYQPSSATVYFIYSFSSSAVQVLRTTY